MSHVPCGDLMTRRRRLPAASAWVLWSSPLLLIVLVLSLGTTGRTGSVSLARAPRARSSASPVATTTSTAPPARLRRAPGLERVSDLHGTTPPSTTPTTRSAVGPTRASAAPSSVASSSSTVPSVSASAGASPTSGPVAGRLDAGLASVVVPLAGPRTWTLASSAPLGATLDCGALETTVATTFAVGSTPCQLTLVDPMGQAVAWQLTPDG